MDRSALKSKLHQEHASPAEVRGGWARRLRVALFLFITFSSENDRDMWKCSHRLASVENRRKERVRHIRTYSFDHVMFKYDMVTYDFAILNHI